jgi:hypothetical protein
MEPQLKDEVESTPADRTTAVVAGAVVAGAVVAGAGSLLYISTTAETRSRSAAIFMRWKPAGVQKQESNRRNASNALHQRKTNPTHTPPKTHRKGAITLY